jgi:hypothetical protein
MKINNITDEFEIGEVIILFLTNGIKEEGTLIYAESDFIKIQTLTQILTIFDDIIGGWAKHHTPEIYNIKMVENVDETNAETTQKINISIKTVKNRPEFEKIEVENIPELLSTATEEKIEILPHEKGNESQTDFIPFEIEDIPWKEDGLPEEEMFKGRDELLDDLIRHYRSTERKKTYVLYGLTRTGKSSVLRYFSNAILNVEISLDRKYKFIPILWDLSRATAQSNAKDMWNYLLDIGTADKIKKFISEGSVKLPDSPILHQKEYRQKDMAGIIEYLKTNSYFPIFLVDEFTYYKDLMKSGKIDASFVANFRQLAYSNLACFIYAGTYNLRRLVSDPDMSITGQFTNTIEVSIGQIDLDPAVELTMSFGNKVVFTEDAIKQILLLSNSIPYFIQIICKNAAFYCYENKINNIDYNCLEEVVKILVGEKPKMRGSHILKISEGAFGNNQYDPTDANGMVLLSSICHLSKDGNEKNEVGYGEIANLWVSNGIKSPNAILNETMQDLKEKGIVVQSNNGNNSIPQYKIGVDLFRRWWTNEKSSDIQMEISKLKSN